MVRIEREECPPVLQRHSGARNYKTCTESIEQAIDERNRGSFAIDNCQVNSVSAAHWVSVRNVRVHLNARNTCTTSVCVVLAEQWLDWNFRNTRVGNILECVGIAVSHRFDQVVISICRLCTHRSDVVAFGKVQCDQRCDALSVWRAFPDIYATVVRADRFVPVGVVIGEILLGEPATLFLNKVSGLLRDLALVERFASAFSNRL